MAGSVGQRAHAPTRQRRGGRRGALEILRQVRQGELRSEEVTLHERRVCVAYLRLEGYTQEEIAEIFAVHRHTVGRDEAAVRKECARLVDELDVRAVAGGLISWARHLTAKAIKERDHGLAWRIQRELVSDLQGLGYLPKAAEQHQVQLSTFADLARLASEADATPVAGPPPAVLPAGGAQGELPERPDAPDPDDAASHDLSSAPDCSPAGVSGGPATAQESAAC